MKITVTSDYGNLSRGRHSARQGNGDSAIWAEKDGRGNLVISEGKWNLHCTDGFKRTARAVITVKTDGSWSMSGDVKRFTVLD